MNTLTDIIRKIEAGQDSPMREDIIAIAVSLGASEYDAESIAHFKNPLTAIIYICALLAKEQQQ